MNEITTKKLPVLMKNGLCHWVSKDTHDHIQEQLARQQSHTFMRILELGISINTSEIEGVYTSEQYVDMVKLKQGMWQCEYGKWHGRKGECNCKEEARRTRAEIYKNMQDTERHEESEEERAAALLKIESIKKEFIDKGVFKKIPFDEERYCVKCPAKLPTNSKYYCSGKCMEKAKSDGTYGREQELQEAANTI